MIVTDAQYKPMTRFSHQNKEWIP